MGGLSHGVQSHLHKERVAARAFAPVTGATFVYDGDGRRVAQTVNGVTTYFVGAHYEVTGSQVTKYYFAGTTRIAMRKYTIPQSMSVEYLLGDHLGSTSITTDNTGAKVSEMRYKAWGEVRYSWTAGQSTTPAYELAKYTFTGQYSYTADPSTGSGQGFGLMFYNARWYDPALGRFAQADTIVPGGVQGWDRYAYTNNNPVRYTDPSGHGVDCGIGMGCVTPPKPDLVNPDNLTKAGEDGYKTYLRVFYYDFNAWWWKDPNLGGDGDFTIEDFVTMNYNEELGTLDASIVSDWQAGLVRSFFSWKEAMSEQYTFGSAGILNFMSRHNGPGTRTSPANFDGPTQGLSVARGAVDAMVDPIGTGHSDWAEGCVDDAPCRIGSHAPGDPDLRYIRQFINSGCQPSYAVFPSGNCGWDKSFFFILDAADSYYWDSVVDQP